MPLRTPIRAALLIGAALLLTSAAPVRPVCDLYLTPVATRGASYQARLIPSPSCPAGTTWRVRKSSTLNTKRQGAPVQPIIPNGSARYGGLFSWTFGKAGGNVPAAEFWTLLTWEWQRYHPERFNPRTGNYGTWERLPQWGGS